MQYYVNMEADENGQHLIHHPGCRHFPHSRNRLYLGIFFKCEEAIAEAQKHYKQVNGCPRCSVNCYSE